MKKIFISILFSLICGFSAFAQPSPTNAISMATVAWTPSLTITTPITNYTVWEGTTSGVYTQSFNAGTNLSLTVSNLLSGNTYYLAATATDANGLVSAYTAPVVVTTLQVPSTPVGFHVTVTSVQQP